MTNGGSGRRNRQAFSGGWWSGDCTLADEAVLLTAATLLMTMVTIGLAHRSSMYETRSEHGTECP